MNKLTELMQKWKKTPERSLRIVAFGSSNTALTWSMKGRHIWADWLSINIREHIGKHAIVIRQGNGGETSDDLLRRLERDVLSLSPEIVMITVGGNDAGRGFTVEHYKDNLAKMCSVMMEKNIQPVLQTYYCPIFDECKEGYEAAFECLMEANRSLAYELDIPLIDQYQYFKPFYLNDKTVYKTIMRDRMHLNHLGQHLMGTIASRSFGLPDLLIPDDMTEEIQMLSGKMNDYVEDERVTIL